MASNQSTGQVQAYDPISKEFVTVEDPTNPVYTNTPLTDAPFISPIIIHAGARAINLQITADGKGTYIIKYFNKNLEPAKFAPRAAMYSPDMGEPQPFGFQTALNTKFKAFQVVFTPVEPQTIFELSIDIGQASQGTQQSAVTGITDTNLAVVTKGTLQGKEGNSRKEVTVSSSEEKVAIDVHVVNQTEAEPVVFPVVQKTQEQNPVSLQPLIDGLTALLQVLQSQLKVNTADNSTLAKDLTLTNGSNKVQIVDGAAKAYGTKDYPLNIKETSPLDISGLAKDSNLVAILNKLITAPSTEAKQDAANVFLKAISDKLAGSLAVTLTGQKVAIDGVIHAIIDSLPAIVLAANQSISVNNVIHAIIDSMPALVLAANQSVNIGNVVHAIIDGLPAGLATADLQSAQGIILAAIRDRLTADPSTGTKQDAGNNSLATIAGKDFATQTTLAAIQALLQGTLKVNTTDVTGLAKETGGNLAALAGKDFATQATLALALTQLQGINADQGTPADAAVTDPTATAGEIALLKGLIKIAQSTVNRPPTGVPTTVPIGASSTTLLAANANRKGATLTSTTTFYVGLFSGCTATLYTTRVSANGYYEVPFGYTGIITGFGSGAVVNVTELI